jgi:hypothetical protein
VPEEEIAMPAKRALSAALALLLAVSFAAPNGGRARSAAGFEYTVTGGAATVTGCTSTCPTTLVIPATLGTYPVTSIGDYAFDNSLLTRVTIPDSVTSIAYGVFYNNRLTRVTIPNSVTSIGGYAFRYNRLKRVTIPNSVTSIGDYAFDTNRLTRVIFLGNAPTAGINVFDNNPDLLQVVRQPSATGWLGTWSDVTVVIAP